MGTPTHSAPVIDRAGGGLRLGVRVSPSARRTAVKGVHGGRLKVSLSAPPEGGRANRELIEVLARWLELRRRDISIESGHGSRDKVVAFTGVEKSELSRRLDGLLGKDGPAEKE